MKELKPAPNPSPSPFLLAVKGLLVLAFLSALPVSFARPAPVTEPDRADLHPVLAVFADRAIDDAQWASLQIALRRELDAHPELATIDRDRVLILRDTQIHPGIVVESVISVRLHGDCSLSPQLRLPRSSWSSSSNIAYASSRNAAPGNVALDRPLGWVLRTNGQIEPFIHVDCGRIAELVAPTAIGRSRDDRAGILSVAIARVILHEWIHIASQSPAHTRQGIERATYSAADLAPSPAAAESKPARGQR